MSQSLIIPSASVQSRRGFLTGSGKAVLSASAVALIVGCESMAASKMNMANADPENDVAILNIALGLEWEAIGAYQIGAESGLLKQPVLDVAVLFQSQHKEHAAALTNTITTFGGKPVAPKTTAEYAKDLDVASIMTDIDVLKLAARLEKGAANAYLGVIPSFSDPMLAQVAGRIAADETMHWTVLANVLGEQLPQKALTFGA